jgi:hypothetical protein
MKKIIIVLLNTILCSNIIAQEKLRDFVKTLPEISGVYTTGVEEDWLLTNVKVKSGLFRTSDNSEIVLSNGIVRISAK